MVRQAGGNIGDRPGGRKGHAGVQGAGKPGHAHQGRTGINTDVHINGGDPFCQGKVDGPVPLGNFKGSLDRIDGIGAC